jgi:hypothetical protein
MAGTCSIRLICAADFPADIIAACASAASGLACTCTGVKLTASDIAAADTSVLRTFMPELHPS